MGDYRDSETRKALTETFYVISEEEKTHPVPSEENLIVQMEHPRFFLRPNMKFYYVLYILYLVNMFITAICVPIDVLFCLMTRSSSLT